MPELPEVEIVRRGLIPLIGSTIDALAVKYDRSWRYHNDERGSAEKFLLGKKINDVQRRGKYLWFALDVPYAVVIHLGMSGQMLLNCGDDHRHCRIVLESSQYLADQQMQYRVNFIDQRTFGSWSLSALNDQKIPINITHIADDIFSDSISIPDVIAVMRRKKSEIKRVLLDQTVLSGIGNIYADESLWAAKIHPKALAHSLSYEELERLIAHAYEIMNRAIACEGTSFDALYVGTNGQSGRYSQSLAVYGRSNKGCLRCNSMIVREKFMNRSSWYCPNCQRY